MRDIHGCDGKTHGRSGAVNVIREHVAIMPMLNLLPYWHIASAAVTAFGVFKTSFYIRFVIKITNLMTNALPIIALVKCLPCVYRDAIHASSVTPAPPLSLQYLLLSLLYLLPFLLPPTSLFVSLSLLISRPPCTEASNWLTSPIIKFDNKKISRSGRWVRWEEQ